MSFRVEAFIILLGGIEVVRTQQMITKQNMPDTNALLT